MMSDEPTERDVEALQSELREAERTAEHWEGLWEVAIERAETAERKVAEARRKGAAEVAERVEALPVHRIKVGWANYTEDMVSVTELRAALRGDG